MNTKKCIVSVLVVASTLATLISNNVKASENYDYYHVGNNFIAGGECFANNMKGDFIKGVNGYCSDYEMSPILSMFTSTPTRKSRNKVNVVSVTNTNIPESTKIPANTKSPSATKTPIIIKTIKPKSTPIPEATIVCKNKNSGKDGTPLECNAGGGQEK